MASASVFLPVFNGFNRIAIWKGPGLVSKIKIDIRFIKFYIQARSHYGLISKNQIADPVVTPVTALVPYYHGCIYAAYQTEDMREVGIV